MESNVSMTFFVLSSPEYAGKAKKSEKIIANNIDFMFKIPYNYTNTYSSN